MEVIRYTIYLTPVSKKNSQQILTNKKTGRPFIMPSAKYRQYERDAAQYLIPRPAVPIARPVEVECLFYMPTRRLADLTNLLEATDDVLVSAGILADDNCGIVVSHDGSRVLYDKFDPRTEITIRKLDVPEQLTMEGLTDDA